MIMKQLDGLIQLVGADNVLTGGAAVPYCTDWRERYSGRALAVVRLDSVEQVAGVVKWCAANHVPIVPQGGNTGLFGGATPDDSATAVMLSLARMCRIGDIDTDNDTMVSEAGCIRSEKSRVGET